MFPRFPFFSSSELKKLGAKSGKGARPTREQARKECVVM